MGTPLPPDETRIAKDTVIFRQGDPGREMFVIADGRVRLTIGAGGYATHIGTLGPGEFFGELSLLTGAPRTATAQAVEDSLLLVISRDVFVTMMQDDLDLVFGMLHVIGERLSVANRPRQRQAQRLGQIRVVAACLRELMTRRERRHEDTERQGSLRTTRSASREHSAWETMPPGNQFAKPVLAVLRVSVPPW